MKMISREELDLLSSRIIGNAFSVSNSLGCGFLEKVYENALAVEFRSTGIRCSQQASFQVRHRNEIVGEYIPDLIVEDAIIVEVKAIDTLGRIQQAQCMNYLRATGLHLALLLNFGRPKVEVRRIVMNF